MYLRSEMQASPNPLRGRGLKGSPHLNPLRRRGLEGQPSPNPIAIGALGERTLKANGFA
jgi:hypothetical protein